MTISSIRTASPHPLEEQRQHSPYTISWNRTVVRTSSAGIADSTLSITGLVSETRATGYGQADDLRGQFLCFERTGG
jgi:hypothetical protein